MSRSLYALYIHLILSSLPLFQYLLSFPLSIIQTEHLPASVPTINDNVGAGSVRASIADKVDVSALELLGLSVTTHGNHAHPEVLDLLVHKVRETGVNVTGGD